MDGNFVAQASGRACTHAALDYQIIQANFVAPLSLSHYNYRNPPPPSPPISSIPLSPTTWCSSQVFKSAHATQNLMRWPACSS